MLEINETERREIKGNARARERERKRERVVLLTISMCDEASVNIGME